MTCVLSLLGCIEGDDGACDIVSGEAAFVRACLRERGCGKLDGGEV